MASLENHKQVAVKTTAFRVVQEATRQIEKPTKARTFDAVAMGRLGGLKGGHARAAILTSARRVEIAKKAAQVRWGKQSQPSHNCSPSFRWTHRVMGVMPN